MATTKAKNALNMNFGDCTMDAKEKLAAIITRKVKGFSNTPCGFGEYKDYFKLHHIAVWEFCKNNNKKGFWRCIVDASETFAIGMNIVTHGFYSDVLSLGTQICVVAVNDGPDRYSYFIPRELAEKVLVLGYLP